MAKNLIHEAPQLHADREADGDEGGDEGGQAGAHQWEGDADHGRDAEGHADIDEDLKCQAAHEGHDEEHAHAIRGATRARDQT